MPTRLVQTRNSPLGVLIGTIREPPETTSRRSQVEVSKYAEGLSILATYRRLRAVAASSPPTC